MDPGDIKDELRRIAREVGKGTFDLSARAVPLADVAEAFASTTRDRLVLVP